MREQIHFLCFLMLFPATEISSAESGITLNDTTTIYRLGPVLKVLDDTTGTLTFAAIRKQYTFEQAPREVPNFGFTNSAYWCAITLTDSCRKEHDWVLDIAMPPLHQVDFFITAADGSTHHGKSGFLVDKFQRSTPFRNPSIELPDFTGKTITVYARVQSETPIILPVFLREKNRYIAYDRLREFLLGLYFGALLIMAIYHFYLYLALRDSSYLWLVFFIITFGLGQMIPIYGYLTDWGVTNLPRYVRYLHFINFLSEFFAIMVSRSMVQTHRFTPKCDLLLKGIGIAALIFTPLSILLSFRTAELSLVLLNFAPLPFLVFSAIIAARKNHRPAYYYLAATSSFITGITVYNLMYGFDLFSFHEIIYFIPNFAAIIMMALFSLGLADKINTIKKEREQAREQAISDLNAKLLLQKEKTAVVQELEHSRKMESIGRLLSGIAHDMKNFLVPVMGYAHLLKRGCREDRTLSKQAERLVTATDRLKDLAVTLVDVSRKKTLARTPLPLNKTIEQLCSLLKHSAPVNVVIHKQFPCEDIIVQADEGMLCSAIMNLGINAIDALPEGGTVTVAVSSAELAINNPIIQRFNVTPGRYASIAVSDNGIGMDNGVLLHIFEPFFTSHKGEKGTGLGLAGVYNFVVSHNGCIDVKSIPGKGTSFILFLPVSRKEAAESLSTNDDDTTYHSGKILIIDDDDEILAVAGEMLRAAGMEPLCFSEGRKAIDYLSGNHAEIEAILLDYSMPELNGSDCLKSIRIISKELPVIIMSAHIPEKDLIVLNEMGCSAIIDKPFDPETIYTSIKAVAGSATPAGI